MVQGARAVLRIDLLAGLADYFSVYGETSDDERNARFRHTQ